MKLIPYESVNGFSFGSGQDALLEKLGNPIRTGKSSLGAKELEYDEATFRYDERTNTLIEVTSNSPVIGLGNISVKFGLLPAFLKVNDPETFQTTGFYVSPMFGIAFDSDYPSWVTAFPKAGLAWWQDQRKF